METSTARPQEAVERRGERRASRGKANDGVCARRGAACGTGHDGLSVYLCAMVRHSVSLCGGAAARTGGKTHTADVGGRGVSLAVRALWGLELDVWQYVGIAGLWLALRRCRRGRALRRRRWVALR